MSYSNYVIYYSNIDSSQQINLTKLEVKLNEIENDFVFVDINSAIEFSEIKRYIDNNIYPKSWTDYDIKYYKEKINKIEHNFNTFLSKIESDNFIEIYSNIKFFYLEQFWRLIANRGIYKKIQKSIFENLLNNFNTNITNILEQSKLVEYLNNELKNYFLNHPQTAEILLLKFVVEDKSYKNLSIPKSLTIKDKEKILSDYLEYNELNPKYLRLFLYCNSADLRIPDTLKLKAKHKEQIEYDTIRTQNSFTITYRVGFSNISQPEKKYFDTNTLTCSIEYGRELFDKSSDIDYFNYFFVKLNKCCDSSGRILYINFDKDLSLMDILDMHLNNGFNQTMEFRNKNMFLLLSIIAYNEELVKKKKNIETILNSVFKSCFDEEFQVKNLSISLHPSELPYKERTKSLFPEIESLLKRYNLYAIHKEIDLELLKLSSQPLKIENVKSLCDIKNVYINNDNEFIHKLIKLLFVNDSVVISGEEKESYSLFISILIHKKISVTSCSLPNEDLLFLLDNGYLVKKDGFIYFDKIDEIIILFDLYKFGYICYPYYEQSHKDIIDKFIDKGYLYHDDKLFSKQESDYFNFHLNKTFQNGLELRNIYEHGVYDDNEEVHKQHYFIVIKLLVLMFFKITFDLYYYNNILCSPNLK